MPKQQLGDIKCKRSGSMRQFSEASRALIAVLGLICLGAVSHERLRRSLPHP
jgi:hypothetical protein